MKKLIFVLSLVVILALSSISTLACKEDKTLTGLTILYTNDTHASLNDIGRRATVVKQIREEAGKDRVLLVDAGDVFTGTLYFTLSQGQADLWFMRYMGYEAMNLGNHEFDKGPQMLADFVNGATFPVLCANFDFSKEKLLAGKINPRVIIQKDGEKYGLFGLTIESTGEISNPGGNIVINDSIQAAKQNVAELKKQGIKRIIALTQIGWDKDLELAKKVAGIDIVIGGHTHTVPEIYPTVVNPSGEPTLVVQAGAQGKYLGRLNVSFDSAGILRNWDNSQLIPIDEKIEADPDCAAKLAEYQKPISAMLDSIIGQTLVDLDGDRNRIRSQETNLGNLVAEAMLIKARPMGASLALINGGAIRSSIAAGDISLGEVMQVTPYSNYLMAVDLNGEQVKAALENGVSQVEQAAGRFPQVAGLRYTWNPAAEAGSRIVSIEVKAGEGYQSLDPKATYTLAVNDFLAGGGDGYTVFKESGNVRNSGSVDYEVLVEYIKTNSPLNTAVDGRIKKEGS